MLRLDGCDGLILCCLLCRNDQLTWGIEQSSLAHPSSSNMYGWGLPSISILTWIKRLLRCHNEISVYSDVCHSPLKSFVFSQAPPLLGKTHKKLDRQGCVHWYILQILATFCVVLSIKMQAGTLIHSAVHVWFLDACSVIVCSEASTHLLMCLQAANLSGRAQSGHQLYEQWAIIFCNCSNGCAPCTIIFSTLRQDLGLDNVLHPTPYNLRPIRQIWWALIMSQARNRYHDTVCELDGSHSLNLGNVRSFGQSPSFCRHAASTAFCVNRGGTNSPQSCQSVCWL